MNTKEEPPTKRRFDGSTEMPKTFWVLLILTIITMIAGWLWAESLISSMHGAEDGEGKVLFMAIVDPLPLLLAICAGFLGILGTLQMCESGSWHCTPLMLSPVYPAIRIPYYWYERIVVEKVPAFGSNPDNVYAVMGLNSWTLGVLWFAEALVVGAILALILLVIRQKISGK
jgi:hypothetical protein